MEKHPTAKPKGWHASRDKLCVAHIEYVGNPSAHNFIETLHAMVVFQQIEKNKCSPHEAEIDATEYIGRLGYADGPLFKIEDSTL